MTTQKWTEDRTAQLTSLVGGESPVTPGTVEAAAEQLGTTIRSIASKLRKLGYDVASMAKDRAPAFSQEEGEALAEFVQANSGRFTYTEVAENFAGGKFTAKQVQGKVLSMELTSHIRPADKVEVPLKYTEQEENLFVDMANQGQYIEAIAKALGKSINSARGKALSLLRAGKIDKIPAQEVSNAKVKSDAVAELGDLSGMTVAEIAEKTGKTERGVRTLLTRRGIKVADYDGAAKREKADAKQEG